MKMFIDVFSNYRVKVNCRKSYINNYGIFSDGETKSEEKLDGYKLIERICSLCQEIYFRKIFFNENLISISHFNPNIGEIAHYYFEIQEIIDEGEED